MRLFDTALQNYVNWQPPDEVRVYVCGITPYDSAHLGHIFTFLAYDLLQRRLQDAGHKVVMVRNITDVDEPIYERAAELGIPYTELAAKETAAFEQTMNRLNFLKPAHEPRASRYIEPMAKAVRSLLDNGYAYLVEQDVYFDIGKLQSFHQLAPFDEKLKLGLFRRRGGDPSRPGKRQPLDFLLWKSIEDPADPAVWDVGMGLPKGRPGWHIECTVMSSELLGVPFDIHGGGNDLIFPHYESEIMQSCALDDVVPARHWVHVAPILYGGEKMSKSLGNLVFARDLLGHYSPDAVRLALMHYHYREGGEWIPELLDEATACVERLHRLVPTVDKVRGARLLHDVRAALDDDLDTHAILHCLEEVATSQPGDGQGQKDAEVTLSLLGIDLFSESGDTK